MAEKINVGGSDSSADSAGLSRRRFIGSAFAGAALFASASLAGCKSNGEGAASIDWDKEADVVIVGCGGCGSTAAVSAAEAGASVIVLESAPKIGGSATLCAGSIVAAGTKLQQAAGVKDSPEQYLSEVEKFVGEATIARAGDDWELFKLQAQEGAATIDWLADMGVEFKLYPYPGHSVERFHNLYPDSTAWPKVVEPVMEEKGVELLLQTKGTELIVNAEGRVIGVKAEPGSSNSPLFIKANKGVLLSGGGFDGNAEIKKKYLPKVFAEIARANGFNDGSAIVMAQKIGADLTDLGPAVSNLMRTAAPGPDAGITQKQKWMPYGLINAGAILVNKEGKRFVNEEQGDDALIPVCEAQTDRICWMIYDEKVASNFRSFPNMIVSSLSGKGWGTVDDFIERGGITVADTIEKLAEAIKVDQAGLAAQIAEWNAACAASEDPKLGRKTFGRQEAGTLGAGLAQPPYYAHGPIHAECNQGWASLRINTDFQVIDVFGDVIPGLYAGGQMGHGLSPIAGGGHGGTMCWALTSGRLAGKKIAAAEPTAA
ncbi:MAG: FAD-dependent oxidoreductase [Coriobacteriia bacterium]